MALECNSLSLAIPLMSGKTQISKFFLSVCKRNPDSQCNL